MVTDEPTLQSVDNSSSPNCPPDYTYGEGGSYKMLIKVLDYDFLPNKNIFIIAYEYVIEEYDGSGTASTNLWVGDNCPDNSNSSSSYVSTYYYRIGYSLDGKAVLHINIPYQKIQTTTNGVSDWSGQHITGFSCHVSGMYLLYTYIVENIGNDGVPVSRGERIVGIINLGDKTLPVGYTQEFIVDEVTYLNYFIQDYLYNELAAIGLHNGG